MRAEDVQEATQAAREAKHRREDRSLARAAIVVLGVGLGVLVWVLVEWQKNR